MHLEVFIACGAPGIADWLQMLGTDANMSDHLRGGILFVRANVNSGQVKIHATYICYNVQRKSVVLWVHSMYVCVSTCDVHGCLAQGQLIAVISCNGRVCCVPLCCLHVRCHAHTMILCRRMSCGEAL